MSTLNLSLWIKSASIACGLSFLKAVVEDMSAPEYQHPKSKSTYLIISWSTNVMHPPNFSFVHDRLENLTHTPANPTTPTGTWSQSGGGFFAENQTNLHDC